MRRFARGRTVRRQQGQMNKTEAAYARQLEVWRHEGVVLWYEFEPVKLRLAEKTFYTPDFMVMRADGEIEIHEVKGFWEDDARVKIKVAADKFPFKFKAVTMKSGRWETEEFS